MISWCLPSKFCISRRQILTESFVKSSIQMRAASYSLPVLRCSDVTRTIGASGNFPWKKEKYDKEAIETKMAFYCIHEILLDVKFTASRQISLSSLYMASFYVSFSFPFLVWFSGLRDRKNLLFGPFPPEWRQILPGSFRIKKSS